jgi:hypothetical protein
MQSASSKWSFTPVSTTTTRSTKVSDIMKKLIMNEKSKLA